MTKTPTLPTIWKCGFTRFSKLPPEVRFLIWEIAVDVIPSRLIEFKEYPENQTLRCAGLTLYRYANGLIPTLLHATRESRMIALKSYPLSFSSFLKCPLPYNSDKDSLYIKNFKQVLRLGEDFHFVKASEEDKRRMKILIFNYDDVDARFYGFHYVRYLVQELLNVQSVYFLMDEANLKRMCGFDDHLYEERKNRIRRYLNEILGIDPNIPNNHIVPNNNIVPNNHINPDGNEEASNIPFWESEADQEFSNDESILGSNNRLRLKDWEPEISPWWYIYGCWGDEWDNGENPGNWFSWQEWLPWLPEDDEIAERQGVYDDFFDHYVGGDSDDDLEDIHEEWPQWTFPDVYYGSFEEVYLPSQ